MKPLEAAQGQRQAKGLAPARGFIQNVRPRHRGNTQSRRTRWRLSLQKVHLGLLQQDASRVAFRLLVSGDSSRVLDTVVLMAGEVFTWFPARVQIQTHVVTSQDLSPTEKDEGHQPFLREPRSTAVC
ncbi:uncharacterized protein WM277_014868 isoform 3-T4 [Molossus nigricans]